MPTTLFYGRTQFPRYLAIFLIFTIKKDNTHKFTALATRNITVFFQSSLVFADIFKPYIALSDSPHKLGVCSV